MTRPGRLADKRPSGTFGIVNNPICRDPICNGPSPVPREIA